MQQWQLLDTVWSKYDIGLIGLIPFAKGEFANIISERNVFEGEATTTKIKASLRGCIILYYIYDAHASY